MKDNLNIVRKYMKIYEFLKLYIYIYIYEYICIKFNI